MSEESPEKPREISIRDVYRQVYDYATGSDAPPPDPPFDVEAGLERLMRSMGALEKEPAKDAPPQESI